MPSNDHWLLDLHGLAQHADGRETATSPTDLVNALKQLSANVQVHVAVFFCCFFIFTLTEVVRYKVSSWI